MSEKQKISGMCAVITNPEGAVVTSYADFDRGGYGGFTLANSQEIRAKEISKRRFTGDHLNGWLSSKADNYFCDQFWRLAESAGYKLTVFPVNNGEA